MASLRLQQHWTRRWTRGKDVIQVAVTLLDPDTNEALAIRFSDVGPFDDLDQVEEELLTECYRLAAAGIPGQGSLPI